MRPLLHSSTALASAVIAGMSGSIAMAAPAGHIDGTTIDHVLLISIDGMHAIDFDNCAHGVPGVNGGNPYCPNLAALGQNGVTSQQASTSRPSDSFPGITALVTGATPKSAGVYYDVSYDRLLAPPAQTTPYGIVGGKNLCPGTYGTQVGFDEEIDVDYTKLDGGGGINPNYLPRDPNSCAPVYPHSYLRVNTIFEVVKAAGGYTAWTDKHPAYEMLNGPSGKGLDDFYGPEINSIPVALPQVRAMRCSPLPDQTAVSSSNAWTDSFANIKCYDALKVQAVINQIDGKNHAGTGAAPVPSVFGMNFQAVSVGEKLVEKSISTTGGYQNADGVASPALAGEIEFVDAAIGQMVGELRYQGRLNDTLVVITAKHGQSPIDPNRVLRIPADAPSDMSPATLLSPKGIGRGYPVLQADEDDVSLIWLSNNTPGQTNAAVSMLEANAATVGANGGEIYAGPALSLMFNDPQADSRTPNIVVAPNVGVVYTGGTKKISEHGGFAHDDTNVMMLIANPVLGARTVSTPVTTAQVAPTIVAALGLAPSTLQAVQQEGTEVLPGLSY
jgi:hypothetical protein